MTTATATMCDTVATSHHSAATRLASVSDWAASQPSMIFRRSHRSTSAPAGNPASNCASASAASTSPEAAADPVSASTSNGNAISEALNPTSDRTCEPHRIW
jgi:hypothetical protein